MKLEKFKGYGYGGRYAEWTGRRKTPVTEDEKMKLQQLKDQFWELSRQLKQIDSQSYELDVPGSQIENRLWDLDEELQQIDDFKNAKSKEELRTQWEKIKEVIKSLKKNEKPETEFEKAKLKRVLQKLNSDLDQLEGTIHDLAGSEPRSEMRENLLAALRSKDEMRLAQALRNLKHDLARKHGLAIHKNAERGLIVVEWKPYMSVRHIEGMLESYPKKQIAVSLGSVPTVDLLTQDKLIGLRRDYADRLHIKFTSLARTAAEVAKKLKFDMDQAIQFTLADDMFTHHEITADALDQFVVTALNTVGEFSDGGVVIFGRERVSKKDVITITVGDMLRAWQLGEEYTSSSA